MIKILTYVVTIICVCSLGLFSSTGNKIENTSSLQVAEVENTVTEDNSQLETNEDSSVNKTEMPEETNVTQEQIVTTQPNTQEKKAQESSSSKPTSTQVTPNVQTNLQPEQIQTQVNTEPQKQQTTQAQSSNNNKESFKENTAIINEIRNIINSNPSTYMKQLGYNIVVDSSIVNKTTGFTYTQTRVKNAIANSFGTIRIYARDYYVGNELRWTEGFIL